MQRQCRSEAELERVTRMKNLHRRDFSDARRVVQDLRQLSLSYPSDNLFVQIDAMDNRDLLQKSLFDNSNYF